MAVLWHSDKCVLVLNGPTFKVRRNRASFLSAFCERVTLSEYFFHSKTMMYRKKSSLDYNIWHFYHFPTVEPIIKKLAFYIWRHSCSQKVPVEQESSLSMGGTIIFLVLFPKNLLFFVLQLMTSQIKLYIDLFLLSLHFYEWEKIWDWIWVHN